MAKVYSDDENAQMAYQLGKLSGELAGVEAIGKKLMAAVEDANAPKKELEDWVSGLVKVRQSLEMLREHAVRFCSDDVALMAAQLVQKAKDIQSQVVLDS